MAYREQGVMILILIMYFLFPHLKVWHVLEYYMGKILHYFHAQRIILILFSNLQMTFQILLRQHDILLKRQFGDIQDTIDSLNKCRHKTTRNQNHRSSNLSIQSDCSSVDISLDNYCVRPANSFTLLNGDQFEDIFDSDLTYRPRTSSMKTTRDLAALARRRGSKDLI